MAYAFHIRETNLATVLRKAAELKLPLPQKSVDELLATLKADLENCRAEILASKQGEKQDHWKRMEQSIALGKHTPDKFHLDELAKANEGQKMEDWKEMEQAIAFLQKNPDEFLKKFLKEAPDQRSKGIFSVTSR